MNLMVVRKGTTSSFIPMELCEVVSGQRVTISQLTSKQSQVTTKVSFEYKEGL